PLAGAAEKEQQDSGDWLAHPRGQGLQPSAEPLQAVSRRREYPPSNPDDRNRKEAHTDPAETFNDDTSPGAPPEKRNARGQRDGSKNKLSGNPTGPVLCDPDSDHYRRV